MLSVPKRRGFTLVEVMLALIIMGVVTGAIYKLLNTNQRLAVAQAEQVTLQSNVRTGSLIVPSELRELNTVALGTVEQNDILDADIVLDMHLKNSVPVTIENPPMRGGTFGASQVFAYMDLGAEGVIPLSSGVSTTTPGHVVIEKMPNLSGESLSFQLWGGITANQTLIQVAAPEAMRGRVTSLIVMFPALISLGSIVVGVGAETLGPRGITGLLAAVGLLLCGWLWLGAPRLRALRVSDYR